ncbi:MAG: CaiB/BaiF CoA transferase family protein, partial [Bacillota bacterium]
GHTGPRKDRPSFDLVLQAEGGAMSITGEPGRPPVRMGLPMGDLAGGLFGAMAISAALVSRDRTGQGQKIDLSLLDCQASLLTYVGQYYLINGQIPKPIGSGHQTVVPYQAFQTSDGWIVVACFANKFWPFLCRVMDLEGLVDDPRFENPGQRLTHKEMLIPILENRFAEKPSSTWLKLLDDAGVPAGPVNTVDQVLADPQVLDRGMVVEMEDAELGNYRMLGNPVKTTAQDQEQTFTTAPGLGEHTGEVLGELLGYDEERIKQLAQAGIITLGRPNGAQ